MKKKRINYDAFIPIAILLVLFVVLYFVTDGSIVKERTLQSLFKQAFTIMLGGFGMMFVMALGSIDMTMGIVVCISSFVSFSLFKDAGLGMFIVGSVVVGIICGLFNGAICSAFKVPSFMITIALQIGVRGAINGVFASPLVPGPIALDKAFRSGDTFALKLAILLGCFVLVVFLLDYSPFGWRCKSVGENEVCANSSGISVNKTKLIVFTISGAFAGLAGAFIATRNGAIREVSGAGFEMTVMLSMFLGGVPVSGGFETKAYKVAVGSLILVLLENGLSYAGVEAGLFQLCEAIALFVIVVASGKVKAMITRREEVIMAGLKE